MRLRFTLLVMAGAAAGLTGCLPMPNSVIAAHGNTDWHIIKRSGIWPAPGRT